MGKLLRGPTWIDVTTFTRALEDSIPCTVTIELTTAARNSVMSLHINVFLLFTEPAASSAATLLHCAGIYADWENEMLSKMVLDLLYSMDRKVAMVLNKPTQHATAD